MATKRRSRKGSYKLTAKRRVALKRAQAISARKRKGRGVQSARGGVVSTLKVGKGYKASSKTKRNLAIGAAVGSAVAITAAGVVARHRISGSSFSKEEVPIVNALGNIKGTQTPSLSSTVLSRQTGEYNTHDYIRLNVRTREKTDVRRTVKGGTEILGRRFSYKTGKQGPLGDQSVYSYNHVPITMGHIRNLVYGKKIPAKSAPKGLNGDGGAINGGVKYRGGEVVPHILEFVKGTPISLESKEVPSLIKGTFIPKRQDQRQAMVGGVPLNQYLENLRRRYG